MVIEHPLYARHWVQGRADSDLGKKKKIDLATGRFMVVGNEMNINENNL